MCLLSILEAYYDRQMIVIRRIVEEALDADSKVVNTILKTILTFKHFACIGFGISK